MCLCETRSAAILCYTPTKALSSVPHKLYRVFTQAPRSHTDTSLERYSQGETDEEELQHLLDEVRNIGRFAAGGL